MSAEAVNLVRFHAFEPSAKSERLRYGVSGLVKGAVMVELAWRWFDRPIPVPMRELAERCNVTVDQMRLALDALEADGYITRTHGDGRSVAQISLVLARVTRAACAGDPRATARVTRALRPRSNWKIQKQNAHAAHHTEPDDRGHFMPGTGWVTDWQPEPGP